MALVQLSDGGPLGTVLGQNAADLISFHGATATDQYVLTTAVSTTTPLSSSQVVWGFQTSDQFIMAIALLNSIRALLVEKGLSS